MSTKSMPAFAKPLSAALLSCCAMAISAPAAAQADSPFSGFYVGLNGGIAWSKIDGSATLSVDSSVPVPSNPIAGGDIDAINGGTASGDFDSKHNNTFTGGLQAGYNYVMEGGLMVGLETDINFMDLKGSRTRTVQSPLLISPPVTYTLDQEADTNYLWTIRPRIGYAMDEWMIFASAGLALTKTKYKARFIDSRTGAATLERSHSESRTGFTFGAGGEYAITPDLSVKAEYLWQGFGNSSASATSPDGYVTLATETKLKSSVFRIGLNYGL